MRKHSSSVFLLNTSVKLRQHLFGTGQQFIQHRFGLLWQDRHLIKYKSLERRFSIPSHPGIHHQLLPSDSFLKKSHQRQRRLSPVDISNSTRVSNPFDLNHSIIREVGNRPPIGNVDNIDSSSTKCNILDQLP